MATEIGREEVRRLAEGGARVVDVLPSASYERLHLPRVTSIPLARLARRAAAELDRDEPVVVYCHDRQ
jgi:rhodanese-related sulfurtransferase